MKKLKVFAATILLIGIAVLGLGLYSFLTLESHIQLMEQFQKRGMAEDINLSTMRSSIISFSIISIIVSLLFIISGLGMFWLKEWVRKLWLTTSILVALIYIYSCISDYYRGYLGIGELLGYFVIWILLLASWLYLKTTKTINLFQS